MIKGSLSFETPMLWAIGFLVSFLFGGLTGVILASPPMDFEVTDSYFVVAHFHYVVFGTVVFATFGGFYFWWPKFTGKMLDERLGKIHFWTLFVGFHTTFLVQHWLGAEGMPRRYADYLAADGFTALNTVSTIGAFLLGMSTLPFLYNVWKTSRYGTKVEVDDPWGFGRSLEWATSCPPPRHNFVTLPRIRSESPAFDLHHPQYGAILRRALQRPGQPVPGRPDRVGEVGRLQDLELEAHQHHVNHHHVEAGGAGAQDAAVLPGGFQRSRRGEIRSTASARARRAGRPPARRTRAWRPLGRRTPPDPRPVAYGGEAGSVRRRRGDAVGPERAPVVAVDVPGDQVPAAFGAHQAVRFDVPAGRGAAVVAVLEAQPLTVAAGVGEFREHARVHGGGLGPRSIGTVKALRALTRRRSRLGSTCSSLARARTEVSPMPSMPCPAAVRSPTATATASSSSSSSGGSSAPAPSW